MNNTWIWTDELVSEFAHWYANLRRPVYDPISDFKKLKEVKATLFTTEDGVEIYEGDTHRIICLHSNWVYSSIPVNIIPIANKPIDVKYFSTEDAAKEYILMNKPCLSVKDIDSQSKGVPYQDLFIKRLKELAKQKLK